MEQMKKDANLIGILLIIGQVLFYAISFLVVLVSFFTGFAEIGQYVGADLGSLVANGGLLGCYWITKQKNLKMQNATQYSFDMKKK